MAKAVSTKIPIDSITGDLNKSDRTLGRERGFAVNMTDNTRDGSIKLSTKRTMPIGGSAARHSATKRYCTCDTLYKYLDAKHKETVGKWIQTARNIPYAKLSNYLWWMKCCLKNWPEKEHFVHHAWWGRWLIENSTDADLVGYFGTFAGMQYPMRSLTDCVITTVSPTHDLLEVLWPQAFTETSVSAYVPLIPAMGTVFVDIYWLYNPPSGWPA